MPSSARDLNMTALAIGFIIFEWIWIVSVIEVSRRSWIWICSMITHEVLYILQLCCGGRQMRPLQINDIRQLLEWCDRPAL